MPYSNIDESLWGKMDNCVEQVMAKQPDLEKSNAIAICHESIVKETKEKGGCAGCPDYVATMKAAWKVGVARDLPIAERGTAWDADAAKARIFNWAGWPNDPNPSKARRAFLVYDSENEENIGAYKLPIADVVGGALKVVDVALGPAASRLPQTDAPADVLDRARAALDGYYDKLRESEKENRLLDRFTASLKQMFPWLERRKQESLDAMRERIWRAFDAQYGDRGGFAPTYGGPWLTDTFPDHIIISSADKYYRVPFTDNGSDVIFASPPEWVEVERKQEWIEKVAALKEAARAKAGARHSKADNDEIQAIHDKAVYLGAECPMVMKQADGTWRWVALSSNAYEDTDGEIVSRKALAQDVEFSEVLGDYGTLDWWHIPALALGVCDFRALHGNVLIESGTFNDARVGEAVSHKANDLQVSLTFYHPHDEPDAQGVFNNIRTTARALLPRGRAANLLTAVPAVTGKESDMASVDLKDKYKEFTDLVGDEALAKSVIESAEDVEKKARDMGLRRKQANAGAGETGAKHDDKPPSTKEGEGEGKPEATTTVQDALTAALRDALAPMMEGMKAIQSYMEKQAAKESGASEADAAKVVEANKQIADHQKAIEALAKTVKELTGEQPRGVKGYQASADPATVLAALKEGETAQPQNDPMGEFMKALGIGNNQPGAVPPATH